MPGAPSAPPPGGAAGPAAVRVWLVTLGPVAADALDVLDRDERTRAAALRHGTDRQRYVAAHVALRSILGGRLGVAPAAVPLDRAACPVCGGPHGRPVIPGSDLQFSLSHTAATAAIATAGDVVGVDIESDDRPVTLADLALALHPDEQPVPDRAAALRLWVRKEAYLKALGTGLARDPATVDLTGDPPGWRVVDVDTGPGTWGAVAVRATGAADPAAPVAPVEVTVSRIDLRDLVAG